METLGFAGSVGCKERVFEWLLTLSRNPCCFYFQFVTIGPDLGCSVLSPQLFLPQSFQNAPPTSLKPPTALSAGARPVPPLLVQVTLPLALTSFSSPSFAHGLSPYPVLCDSGNQEMNCVSRSPKLVLTDHRHCSDVQTGMEGVLSPSSLLPK